MLLHMVKYLFVNKHRSIAETICCLQPTAELGDVNRHAHMELEVLHLPSAVLCVGYLVLISFSTIFFK